MEFKLVGVLEESQGGVVSIRRALEMVSQVVWAVGRLETAAAKTYQMDTAI